MAAGAWVAIGIAVGSFCGTVIMWLVNRRTARSDAIEREVFGREGLRADIAAVRAAGDAREERILDAINAQSVTFASEIQELRTEVSEERQRVQRDLDARIELTDRSMRDLARRIDGITRLHRA